PPQGGGYPPPAPGVPAYGGYGAPQYSVSDAFSWAWNKFGKNAGPLIVATLVDGIIVAPLQFITNPLTPSSDAYSSGDKWLSYAWSTSGGGLVVSIIGWLVLLVVGAVIQSAYIGGLLDIANGQQVSYGSFFRPRSVGNVIIAGVIVGLLTSIGLFLCILPGLVVALFTIFTIVALLDRNLSPTDAIKTTVDK